MCSKLQSLWRQRRSLFGFGSDNENSDLTMNQDMDDHGSENPEKKDNEDPKDEDKPDVKNEDIPALSNPNVRAPLAQLSSVDDLEKLSKCPVELGIVSTPWGPIAAGTVIAAIAAGIDIQERTVADLSRSSGQTISDEVGQLRVKNWWAATLAGDIAQVAIFQIPRLHGTTISIGGEGAWNSTDIPRWYFLREQEDFEMTSAEIRAGIDGALIANKMREWNGGNLRLSQILEMYYSERGVGGDRDYRACKRMDNYKNPERFSEEDLKLQVQSFAHVLFLNASDVAMEEDNVNEYAANSYSEFSSAVGRISDDQCVQQSWDVVDYIETVNTTTVDLYLVINYDEYMQAQVDNNKNEMWEFVGDLAKKIDLSWYGSNIGIFGARDGKELIALNATKNSAELAAKLRFIPQWSNGMEVSTVLAKLREHFFERRDMEEELNVGASNGTVVLFLTNTRVADSERENLRRIIREYDYDFPDVRIMFATGVQSSDFKDYVDDENEDVIKVEMGRLSEQADVVADGLTRVHSRLIYSRCGSNSKYYSDAEVNNRYIGAVTEGYTQFFRINPKYFFSSEYIKIKFETRTSNGNIRVCYSRTNKSPTKVQGGQQSGVTCTDTLQGVATIEYSMHQPCGSNYNRVGCSPIYISVQGLDSTNQCYDQQCRFPNDIVYTYTHDGMRCNGAISLFLSKHLLLVSIIIFALKSFFSETI